MRRPIIESAIFLSAVACTMYWVSCEKDIADQITNPRYYAQVSRNVDNLVGVRTSILTRYGKVFEEGISDEETHTWAYCAIGKEYESTANWAQMGFSKDRPNGYLLVLPSFSCEVMGESYQVYFSAWPSHGADPPYPPADGSVHNYRCELDSMGSLWHFFYDQNEIVTGFSEDAVWLTPGSSVAWAGEISHILNDMPGTPDSHCVFSDIMYKIKGSDYVVARCGSSDYIGSTDASEWRVTWDTANSRLLRIDIWDCRPLQ